MAGRISLLILVTGLFASAWSSDRPPLECATQLAQGRTPPVAESVRVTRLHRWRAAAAQLTAANADWKPTAPAEACPPSFAPAGIYLVVDADGRCERIEIAAGATAPISSADHFVSHEHGVRRHWIRLSPGAQEIGVSARRRGDSRR